MRAVLVVLVLALVGCSAEDPAPSPSSEPVETFTARPAPDASQSESGQAGDFSISSVLPDPAIMATMECEPLSDDVRSRISDRWGSVPAHSVQVEVGEGLTEGELWWVISWVDEGGDPLHDGAQHLTNAPGLPSGVEGTWISSGGVYVQERNATFGGNVRWDAEGIARAQSALATSLDCLEASA